MKYLLIEPKSGQVMVQGTDPAVLILRLEVTLGKPDFIWAEELSRKGEPWTEWNHAMLEDPDDLAMYLSDDLRIWLDYEAADQRYCLERVGLRQGGP